MAKAENIELTEEEAAQAFAKMNKNGELSDEELDNVSGGCGDEIQWDNKNLMAPRGCDVKFAFEIGTRVVRYGYFYYKGTIIDRRAFRYDMFFQGEYLIHFDDPSENDKWVNQAKVGIIVG